MKDSQSLPKKQRKFIKKKPTNNPVAETPVKESVVDTIKIFKPSLPNWQFSGNNLFLLLIPVTLFFVFLIFYLINNNFLKTIAENELLPFPTETQISSYPVVNPSDQIQLLPISAKSAIIVDVDSQVSVFAKNPQLRFSMASTTKIMTALTALDYYKNDSVLTIKTSRVEGTVLSLPFGDQFYFEDLLYAMLLPSANDAAVAVADNYPGGQNEFVAKMNEKAAVLHLTDTHFVDSDGLEDDGDYTTVVDMARLASVALQNKEFAKVVGTKQKIISDVSKSVQYPLFNLNKLLGVDGVIGIKTGTTEGAGQVLVTAAVVKGHTFIIVVMNSEQRFVDTEVLLDYIQKNISYINPVITR